MESEELCEAGFDLVVLKMITSRGIVSDGRAEYKHCDDSDVSASSRLSASTLDPSILHGRKCVIQLFESRHNTGRCSCTKTTSGVFLRLRRRDHLSGLTGVVTR